MLTQSAVKTAKEYLMSLPTELDVRRANDQMKVGSERYPL